MTLSHTVRRLFTRPAGMIALLAAPALAGCPSGDVGAPCNHGDVNPPDSKLVTFPALACNDLLCVYADEAQAPDRNCNSSADCNDGGETRFDCVNTPSGDKECRLSMDHVLERSMCSTKCSSDDDCKNGGPGNRVVEEDSTCDGGFQCARIQELGEFCCTKMCVCVDDLGVTTDLDQKCSSNSAPGCCVDENGNATGHEGCGVP